MHSFSTDKANRHRQYIIIGIVSAAIYFGAISLYGTAGVSIGFLSTGIYYAFARYLWKWDYLHRIGIIEVPNLNGTWNGYIYTSEDPENIPNEAIVAEGTQKKDKIKMETELEIEQTWDKILITLGGAESSSYSRSATILVNEKAWPTLSYNYFNEGGSSSDGVGPHYGSAMLELDEERDKLEGRYFNRPDHRGTHGMIEVWREE